MTTKTTEELRSDAKGIVQNAVQKAMLELESLELGRIKHVRTWVEADVRGPLGEVSHQVVAALEIDGQVVPITVAIYSDDRIGDLLENVLDEEQEQAELKKRLGWT